MCSGRLRVERLSNRAGERRWGGGGGRRSPSLGPGGCVFGALCDLPHQPQGPQHKNAPRSMRPSSSASRHIWETLSVPLTFAPIHSPTYLFSKIFSPDAVLALGNLQASGPALLPVHPLLRTFFFSSCLCNADPPSPDTLPHPRPHYSTLNSWVVGVPRSEN